MEGHDVTCTHPKFSGTDSAWATPFSIESPNQYDAFLCILRRNRNADFSAYKKAVQPGAAMRETTQKQTPDRCWGNSKLPSSAINLSNRRQARLLHGIGWATRGLHGSTWGIGPHSVLTLISPDFGIRTHLCRTARYRKGLMSLGFASFPRRPDKNFTSLLQNGVGIAYLSVTILQRLFLRKGKLI